MNQVGRNRRLFLKSSAALGGATLVAMPGAYAAAGDVTELSAVEAVAAMQSGAMSAEAYAEALLERCAQLSRLSALTAQDANAVRAAARAADRKRAGGARMGMLHGLPILLKDNIATAGVHSAGATPALREFRPSADAPVAAALWNAGGLLLGKTNMHELAFGITSNNAAYGAVSNPYDGAKIAGGSSGGNGAALAARMGPAALGTDTGGSVRIPAALCGVAGLRPSIGRYPGRGIVPISHTRDTAGPMARRVADLALLDSAITGNNNSVTRVSLAGLRLGVPRGAFWGDLDGHLAKVVEAALVRLRTQGAVLVEVDLPNLHELNNQLSFPIALYEVAQDLPVYLAESGSGVSLRELVAQIASPDVRGVFETFVLGPKAMPLAAYEAAMNIHRPALQKLYADYFSKIGVAAMFVPTTPLPARPIGHDNTVELNGAQVPTFFTYIRNTDASSNAGIPGLSLPAGLTADGLPVGIELDGPAGSDRQLLGIGLAVEAALGAIAAPRL